MIVYVVGYQINYDPYGTLIVAVYSDKQKADQLRQRLQEGNKGDIQFVIEQVLDPVTVVIS